MLSELERIDAKKKLDDFLNIREIDPKYSIPYRDDGVPPYGYIYCIENLKNGKKYVGSTYSVWSGIKLPDQYIQLRKRASNYLYEYRALLSGKKISKNLDRPIIRAMVDFGIDNFIMYPIAETTKHNHYDAEEYFIKLYNTRETGYNITLPYRYQRGHKNGYKHTSEAKKLRSVEIIAINISEQKLIYADSMKLFGDYMNSSKDMIKNSVRKCRIYKGWYIFYTDRTKRKFVIDKNVLGEGLPKGERHSPESQELILELDWYLTSYLLNEDSELFPNFTIEELRY
jgi:hypothetical protein|nr:MAG TPA: intron associated endonuclease [Caudoviricetes sp.]